MSDYSLVFSIPGHVICSICIEATPIEDLYIDQDGDKWDMCKPCQKREAEHDAT